MTPDDPRLSASLFGELEKEDADLVRRSAAADPAIRMSLVELEKVAGLLSDSLSEPSEEVGLLPSQRTAILRAVKEADQGLVIFPSEEERSWRPWMIGLGAAAAVALAAFSVTRLAPAPGAGDESVAVMDEVALLPFPGPGGDGRSGAGSSPGGDARSFAGASDRKEWEKALAVQDVAKREIDLPAVTSLPATGSLPDFQSGPDTQLPILIGSSSYHWVSGWILGRGELPPRDAVRVEELINVAALKRSPEKDNLRVTVEATACPWNPESVLVGVQLEAGDQAVEGLEVLLRSSLERRVLGSFARGEDLALPDELPAGRRTLVLVELRGDGSEIGGVEIRQKDRARFLPVSLGSGSRGLDQAASLAAFGLWLRGEGVSSEDLRQLISHSETDSDPVRADQRRMIQQALELSSSGR